MGEKRGEGKTKMKAGGPGPYSEKTDNEIALRCGLWGGLRPQGDRKKFY